MSQFCLNPACRNPRNPDQNKFCQGCGANLADSTQSYQFDYYRVTKLLGQGGFGRTYLAEYSRRYNQPRVIKTLINTDNEQNQQKIREFFAREAAQLCNLDHPQIPKLYEYFERDNSLFLVQEFIDGISLQEEFNQLGAFDEQKIQIILEELLPVLAYIQEKNILHRDIKPDNIMRRRSDGKLILIDFGAARVKTGKDPSILTAICTPGYAAIEHINGRPVKASDVYSLGVTCIRLLTSCFPSDNTDPIYDDHNNCLRWKTYLQQKNLKINERLTAIIDKMTASSLGDRYSDAQAVLEDFTPTPIPLPEKEKKESKKFGWLVGSLAISTVILAMGWYSFYKDTLQTTLKLLENYYNEEKYQECYQLDINNLYQDNIEIQELQNKCSIQISLVDYYNNEEYQECYQLATNNPYKDDSHFQKRIGTCGLELSKIRADFYHYKDAIIIAQTIPSTVPNHQEVKESIDNWAVNILNYATKLYKQGKLEDAIKITNEIPENTSVKTTIPEKIFQWQQEKAKHQSIINNAQNFLNQGKWEAAQKEVSKIANDFILWREQAQPILDKANQQIAAEAKRKREAQIAEEAKRKREEQAAAEEAKQKRQQEQQAVTE